MLILQLKKIIKQVLLFTMLHKTLFQSYNHQTMFNKENMYSNFQVSSTMLNL